MSYLTTTFPSRTVTSAIAPVTAQRGAHYLALGALRPTAWLRRYPNGRPRRGLSGYEQTSFLKAYPNGRPMESLTGTPKQALVVMALNNAMAKKCGQPSPYSGGGSTQRKPPQMNQYKRRGMRGLGDDGSIDTSDEASVEDASISDAGTNTGGSDQTIYGGNYPTPTSGYGGAIPAMSTIAGAPSIGINTNPLSSLLNSLLGGTTSPYAYNASPFGTSLQTPLYAGASISTGGALAICGIAVLFLLITKKR